MELNKSDYTGSSSELSLEEISDAHAFGLSKKAQSDHDKTLIELQAIKLINDLVKKSKVLTEEADKNFTGTRPSMSDAKAYEKEFSTSSATNISLQNSDHTTKNVSIESERSHSEMMEAILQSINEGS